MKLTSTRGVWDVEDTVVEDLGTEHEALPSGHEFNVQRSTIHLGGQAHLRARNEAIAALFGPHPEFPRGQMTVLTLSESGSVRAIEGRYVDSGGRPFLLRKGTQRTGYYLDRLHVLEVVEGYKPKLAAAAWLARKAGVPELAKFSLDDVPERTEDEDGIVEHVELIQAVYIGTHPGFGLRGEGRTAGCMWLVTDKQTDPLASEYDLVNGYFWCPEGADLTSEHGSVYVNQLERWAGRVRDFKPGGLTFRQCVMDEIPGDPLEAYRFVTSRTPVAVS